MRALDLFCGAGGATRGIQIAGYHVTGIDNRPQPRYCGNRFFQDDAMAWLRGERERLDSFDLIWLSPPCQRYSNLTPTSYKATHPDLLPAVLELARTQPVPYVCENVESTQSLMRNPLFLCGTMFGLNIWRHRWFEIGNVPNLFFLLPPCNHDGHPVLISGTTRLAGRRENTVAERRAAAQIDWMTKTELDNAIPPAYSCFLVEEMRAIQTAPGVVR